MLPLDFIKLNYPLFAMRPILICLYILALQVSGICAHTYYEDECTDLKAIQNNITMATAVPAATAAQLAATVADPKVMGKPRS